ncbi:MAG: sulfatase-like hydrolase/transferase, partial [Chitinophagales bacterium]|nr:sulfatase-like hydrolase/transferase [Chitinophagales bacterium]
MKQHAQLFLLALCLLFHGSLFSQTPKPNIIFIISDDLNDYVSAFGGHPQAHTPKLDSLAHAGILFTNVYCSAPGCGPSRASMLSGKDCLYTDVYNNSEYQEYFRDNFTPAHNNEFVVTLPEHLKNEGGYFTYGINKIFHDFFTTDFDETSSDICEKELSWNKISIFNDFYWVESIQNAAEEGVEGFQWSRLDDTIEHNLKDFRTVDTVLAFIRSVQQDPSVTCNKPFFMAVGIAKP